MVACQIEYLMMEHSFRRVEWGKLKTQLTLIKCIGMENACRCSYDCQLVDTLIFNYYYFQLISRPLLVIDYFYQGFIIYSQRLLIVGGSVNGTEGREGGDLNLGYNYNPNIHLRVKLD